MNTQQKIYNNKKTYKEVFIMTKHTQQNKRVLHKAFTLVELLIVIAIIGILFIVLISKIDFATDKAKATGVYTDFRSFELALETVSREHAGFNTFGWDTGDLNADGKRNHYDEGDTNKDGIQDAGETWTGRQQYTETWTGVYTLVKPGTNVYDATAMVALETAINANLDPKLHVTIKDDGTISMANGAQDPWNTEYHGYYITNSTVDKKDRGAIVIYSNGANQTFGSSHQIANGVVTINIPNNNLYGKDDYNISVIYTYANGYGEIIVDKNTISPNKPNVQPDIEGDGSNQGTETDPPENNPSEEIIVPGLYKTGSNYTELLYSWQQLIDLGILNNSGLVSGNETDESTPSPETIELMSGEILWPENLTRVPDNAFRHCVNITDIKLHDNVSSLGEHCFSFTGIVNFTVPPKVTSLDFTFFNASALETVTFHDQVRVIEYAFKECTSLTSITLPEGLTTLGAAFTGCSSLTNLYLPSTITKIEGAAFWNCSALNHIYFAGTLEQWCKIDMGGWDHHGSPMQGNNPTLYINNQPVENIVIPDSITEIKGVFYNCDSLKSVIFPEGLTKIGLYTFSSCNNLASIHFPSTLKTIEYRAFANSPNLKDIVLNEGLETINGSVFEDTWMDQTIFIPNSVKTIGSSAFRNSSCTIQWDPINSQLETIQGSAFYSCEFNELIIPDNITTLNGAVFNEAYYTSLHIGKNLSTITRDSAGWGPFMDSSRYLNSITVDPENDSFYVANGCLMDANTEAVILGTKHCTAIPYWATAIEQFAFYKCYGLQSIVIPDTIKRIEAYTFHNCTSLKSIEINSNIEYIGSYAFNKCYNLTSITINSTTVPTVSKPDMLFDNCTSLQDIFVNSELVEQYKSSEYWSKYADKIKAKE